MGEDAIKRIKDSPLGLDGSRSVGADIALRQSFATEKGADERVERSNMRAKTSPHILGEFRVDFVVRSLRQVSLPHDIYT